MTENAPSRARCSQCKRGRHKEGHGYNVTLTGEKRKKRTMSGRNGRMDVEAQYGYQCLDCGHVGWSRHVDLKRMWDALTPEKRAQLRRVK